MIASEYSWTLDNILDLTLNQLNIQLVRIGERKKQESMTTAILMRISVIGAMSKEGARQFDKFVKNLSVTMEEIQKPVCVKTEDLAKFSMGYKRG